MPDEIRNGTAVWLPQHEMARLEAELAKMKDERDEFGIQAGVYVAQLSEAEARLAAAERLAAKWEQAPSGRLGFVSVCGRALRLALTFADDRGQAGGY